MSLIKNYTFEVTPKHPARKIYDKVLFPDGFSYPKVMSGRQALAALAVANDIKVLYNNKWYKVTQETMESVLSDIDELKVLTIPESEIGVRSIASYITSVKLTTKVGVGNWLAGKFANVKIEAGEISGELYKAENITEFSSSVIEQNGYYIPIGWIVNTEFTAPKMRVVNGLHPTSIVEMDPENLIFLGDSFDAGHYKIIEITAKDKDDNDVKIALNVSNVKFLNSYSYHATSGQVDPPDAGDGESDGGESGTDDGEG